MDVALVAAAVHGDAGELLARCLERVEGGRRALVVAADHGDHGLLRRLERLIERFELILHRASGISRQLVREAFGRGMGAVRRTEGVVYIDLGQAR